MTNRERRKATAGRRGKGLKSELGSRSGPDRIFDKIRSSLFVPNTITGQTILAQENREGRPRAGERPAQKRGVPCFDAFDTLWLDLNCRIMKRNEERERKKIRFYKKF
ncbi:hypothetical protein EVAR_17749_1 [Eumeta japonica]|uniref:Uncharacterized protein n=1 Tax=Eumeta variegata TaxID=151549 RepID=A0A4C1TTB8_EUMVA|nr:hypothetical protein EVAR_17749_1 [Eumeta japonica]